jgi:hypothetical protein
MEAHGAPPAGVPGGGGDDGGRYEGKGVRGDKVLRAERGLNNSEFNRTTFFRVFLLCHVFLPLIATFCRFEKAGIFSTKLH